MESIGLFEAKTHLSELIARAERGEEVIKIGRASCRERVYSSV